MAKTKEKQYEIWQERAKCIGCGACVATCPENWVMAKDGKSKPKKKVISQSELGCNKQAANICPVSIIRIKEKK